MHLTAFYWIGLTVMVALAAAASADPQSVVQLPCLKKLKCSSSLEDVVWASDGQRCFVFRNGCYLEHENCQRKNRYQEVLKTLPKDDCQKLCPDLCTLVYRPVCAEYNGAKRSFSNNCFLGVHICKTGETYDNIVPGECQNGAI